MSVATEFSRPLKQAFMSDLTSNERASISNIMEAGTVFAINYIRDTFLNEMAAPKDPKDITIKINMRDKTKRVFQGCIRRENLIKQEKELNKDIITKIEKTDEIKQELTKALSKHLAKRVALFLLKEVQQEETPVNGIAIIFALDKCEEIHKNRIHPTNSILVQHACNIIADRFTSAPETVILLLKSIRDFSSWT